MAQLTAIVDRLDSLLEIALTPDYPPAHNGLQFANSGAVHRVSCAVDYCARTVADASAAGANLLVVHHGMFWSGTQPVVGTRYEVIRNLVKHDIAVYSAHLPLDRHATLGNNVLLAAALGLQASRGFGRYQHLDIGVAGEASVVTQELVGRAATFAAQHGGTIRSTTVSASRRTERWAIVTGAGASTETLLEAQAAGIDTLLVGEGPHHTAVLADELGICVVYVGHYASETLGVQAVGRLLSSEFGVPWSFIAAPTGL